jgi:hypothetical protein
MSNAQLRPPGDRARASGLERLAAYGNQVGYGLFGAALLLGALVVFLLIRYRLGAMLPVFLWALASFLTVLIVALSHWAARSGDPLTVAEGLRFRLLLVGGLMGLFATALGLVLPFTDYADVFGGGIKQWRQHPAALVWTGLALFGGLILLFVSLQLARGMERVSSAMRRLLFGYNTVLSSFLLLAILMLFNVIGYPFPAFTTPFDWTSSGRFTLSDRSKNILEALKEPVTVYVILTGRERVFDDMQELLSTCRTYTDKLRWEALARDVNRKQIEELLQKYPVATDDPYGLLVVYGTAPQAQWDFVPFNDLRSESFNPRDPESVPKYIFKGEDALMKMITYLQEGKSRMKVYFTQGDGELDLNDRGLERGDQGMGLLHDRLVKGNYEVNELRLTADKGVPADADVVVVARPGGNGLPLPDYAVKALRDYANGVNRKKKGRLIVLLDVVTRTDGGMVKTGLEALLAGRNVRAGDDRVLTVGRSKQTAKDDPTDLWVITNWRSKNPVAQAFKPSALGEVEFFEFMDARTVDPGTTEGTYRAETLVQSVFPDTWVETDLKASPRALWEELQRPENRERLVAKLAKRPVSLGVSVTEGKGPAPMMPPGHPAVGGESQPSMVVFGDATWISNQALRGRQRDSNYSLFINCLSWLRERPDIGRQAPDKEAKDYTLTVPQETVSRMKTLPAALMLLGILCLAGGVWVVRRR